MYFKLCTYFTARRLLRHTLLAYIGFEETDKHNITNHNQFIVLRNTGSLRSRQRASKSLLHVRIGFYTPRTTATSHFHHFYTCFSFALLTLSSTKYFVPGAYLTVSQFTSTCSRDLLWFWKALQPLPYAN